MATSRKIALLLGAEALSALLGWLAIKLVLLRMGQAALGELAFALSLVGGFTFLVLLGFTQAHIKRVSEGQDLGRCVGTFTAIRVVLLGVMTLAVLGGLAFWLYVLDKPLTDASPRMIVVILLYYLLFYLMGVPRATFTALEESAKVTLPNLVGTVIRLCLMCLAALWGLASIWLGYAYLLGALVSCLLYFWLFGTYPVSRPDRELFGSYFRFARPLMVVVIITTLATYADKVVLGIFWEAEQLGAFFAEQRLIALLITLAATMEALLFPQLSNMYSRTGDLDLLRERVHLAERWLGLVLIPVMAVIWALPEPILMVLLSQDVAHSENSLLLLRLLGLTYLLRVLSRPYSVTLKAIDRSDLVAWLGLVSGLTIIFLNLALVPRRIPQLGLDLPGWGALGAATALLTAATLLYLGRQYQNRRYLQLTCSPRLVVMLAGGLATMLVLEYLDQLWTIQRWYELALAGLAGGTFFLGLMTLLGQFGRRDLDLIRDTLDPRKMGDYMRDELGNRRR